LKGEVTFVTESVINVDEMSRWDLPA